MTAAFQPASSPFATEATPAGTDFLPLKGTDHVEFYVGNARQAAYFYRAAFGMSLVAYAGPETGQRDRATYVVQQEKVRFVLTPLCVARVRLLNISTDTEMQFASLLSGWTMPASMGGDRQTRRNQRCRTIRLVRRARAGCLIEHPHLWRHHPHLVERGKYTGPFLPGFRAVDSDPVARPVGLLHVDHMVGNVGWKRWTTGSIVIEK